MMMTAARTKHIPLTIRIIFFFLRILVVLVTFFAFEVMLFVDMNGEPVIFFSRLLCQSANLKKKKNHIENLKRVTEKKESLKKKKLV